VICYPCSRAHIRNASDRSSSHDANLSTGCLAVALAVGWCIAHRIPYGLVMFPEARYTYANLLVLVSGAAAWLAHVSAGHRSINANLGTGRAYEADERTLD
jgi:hypothetical protein